MKSPWMKFYPADWRADPRLRSCSLAARGLWVDMITYMHEGEPYGHLTLDGKAPDVKGIASLVARPVPEVKKALAELEERNVFSRSAAGAIVSRRMVRDQAKAEKDRKNGKGGGNPNLRAGVNPKPPSEVKPQKLEPRSQSDDGGEDAGARGQISKAAFSISERLYAIFDLDPEFIPPGWCGAPRWVQKCLNEGIPQDVIISSAEGVKGRKRDGPPGSFNYLEKPLARDWASHNAPLPTVQLVPQEPIREAYNGHQRPAAAQSNGIVAAGKRRLAQLAEIARGGDFAAEGDAGDAARDPDVRLLPSR